MRGCACVFADARDLERNSELRADVCIVGGGAAGITLARELIGQPFDVCLLESGGLELDVPTQMLCRGASVGVPYLPLEATRLRYFGGTTNHWGGASRPLDAIDFERRDWVPESGWPFGRAQLEPYYRRAQPLLELGPFAYEREDWRGAGLAPPADFDRRVLRSALLQNSPPTRFGKVYRDALERAPNIRVYLHANVLEIETAPDGASVRRLRARTLGGPPFYARARLYVLALGGIENARLLLLSDRVRPGGVGNGSGRVGRYFMEHPHFHHSKPATLVSPGFPHHFYKVRTRAVHPAAPDRPAEVWGFLAPTAATLRERGLLNFGIALVQAPEEPIAGIESARAFKRAAETGAWPDDFWRHVGNVVADLDEVALYSYHWLTGREPPARRLDVAFWTEQRPNPDSRVYLSTDERDALGQRRIVFDWRLTEQDRETMRAVPALLAHEVGKVGLGRVRIAPEMAGPHPESMLQPSFHHMGTTRMHADPRRGVVDANCRMHEVSNLYVAGSSVFPAVGQANPTITIVALAIRLADHLKQVLRRPPETIEGKR